MVNIAILGYGNVGCGVAELIGRNADRIRNAAARPIQVKYILDIRNFPDSPFADRMVKDFGVIERDPDIQIVVECIGGVKAAREFTQRALLAGKSVVTSNKELVAEHGDEFLRLAREGNLNYLFEASVGGGIPIIRPISQCLAANRITEICGILNGTSNFILTAMRRAGSSFDTALAEARRLGYAELNPVDDINGMDVCRKICILASLAFGRHIYPRLVSAEGMDGITAADLSFAEENGLRIKLLGRAALLPDGKLAILAAPHLVPLSHPLSTVDGVYNGILVRGDAIGDVMFTGQGAGSLPTASAVTADVIDAAKHFHSRKYMDWEPCEEGFVTSADRLPCRWYTRPDGSRRFRILIDGEATT